MSGQFEIKLAEWLHEHLDDNPPRAGQKLLAEFHDPGTADRFAASLVEHTTVEVQPIPGSDESLPALITLGGVPVFVARVKPEVGPDSEEYVITQGFATRMRNLVSESTETDTPIALLMVLEADATLDTLEASENLFGEDSSLSLESFRTSVLDPDTCENKQGRALLTALNEVLSTDSLYAEDVGVLDTLCEIRHEIDNQNATKLSQLIGELPEFIREDYIDEDWFSQTGSESDLADSATEFLSDNRGHARRLRRAHRTGTDTASNLTKNYEDTFVRGVTDAASWKTTTHTEAEKHQIERTSRQFRDLEVDAAQKRIFSPTDEDAVRRAVVAVASEGTVRLSAEFSADLDDVPHEFLNNAGNEAKNTSLSKRENRLTARVENLPADEPTYGRLLLYVGKKTTQGQPTHEFDLAVVPSWFFDATKDTPFDVDVEGESVVRHGDDPITLHPPERLDFDFSETETTMEVAGEDLSVAFTGTLILDPTAPEAVERVSCLVSPQNEIPIRISFLTEVSTADTEEMVFPLMLAAINDPSRWSDDDDLQLLDSLSIDTDRGEIYTAKEEGIRLEETPLEIIQTEEELIREGAPQQRYVDAEELRAGEVRDDDALSAFPELRKAYHRLFEHFNERNRTPSTDPWDQETLRVVEEVLEAYQASVANMGEQPDFGSYEPLRELGTITSTVSNRTWLTPFHPVMLAYAFRIATWRDETLVPNGATGGFRSERFLDRFNPSGLLPYIVSQEADSDLLRGLVYEDNPLWTVYSPVESPGSVTPKYMERVIRDKLDTFMHSFPLLFQLHEGRHFVINLINMGELRPIIKGLYEFFKRVEKSHFDPPQILLRIYGGPAEGEALDQFFGDNAQSRLRVQLEQKDDEIVDRLRSNLMYVREDEYTKQSHKNAHISLFRGLLTESSGITELGDLPSGMLLDGLLPRESIDVQPGVSGTVYSVGFGAGFDDDTLVESIAQTANTLEAGCSNNKYLTEHTLKKTIQSSHKADLKKLWDDSLWVVHVQPNVGLEFYIESNEEIGASDGMVMIHYNDQYDSSSPNYDVITSTTHQNPYITALERALKEARLSEYLDARHVLSTLIAIDGELALELQHTDDKGVIEKTGFVGGLGLSKQLLEASSSDYTWIPLSLNELARHDRATRGDGSGILQYVGDGAASDDICMVGLPDNLSTGAVKLWIVETKGGTSGLKKGREQVEGAIENLRSIFHPDINYSDAQLLYSEFGKTVVDVAKRMQSYGVLTESEIEAVKHNQQQLLEGDYIVDFLTDKNGHIGEVIRIRPDTAKSDPDLSHPVRTIDAPLKTLHLLGGKSVTEVLPDLNISQLGFDISSSETGRVTNPIANGEPASSKPHVPADEATSGSEGVDAPQHGPSDTAVETTSTKTSKTPSESNTVADTEDSTDETPAETKPENDVDEFEWQSVSSTEEAVDEDEPDQPVDTDESTSSKKSTDENQPVDTDAGESEQSPDIVGTNSGSDGDTSVVDPPEPDETVGETASEHTGTDRLLGGEPTEGDDAVSTTAKLILDEMEQSVEPDAKIDRSKLVSDLRREFDSLGVQIHPPNPASISVGPRKIGVNVHPKEGQTVEGILQKLNSLSVHIQAHGDIVGAPNPAEGAVRLEIPHSEPVTVFLRDGIETLWEELQAPVTIPLGVDVENNHHALSMLQEKHALVAGATGSGKSNFLSSIVASLAITQNPERLKMSILDPKGVDFGRFEELPHVQRGTYLDTPEDCTRYLMELLEEELPERKQHLKESGFASVGELNEYADEMGHDPLPYHVIIIDEYADLIMSLSDGKDEFENAVTRLAQVGRAHGFVIFLATQRPSADIVSGKIKTNFPCRISFRLPSNTDSRVILDEPGAEDLHGAGDMIVHTQEGKLRLQGYRLSPKDAIALRSAYSNE